MSRDLPALHRLVVRIEGQRDPIREFEGDSPFDDYVVGDVLRFTDGAGRDRVLRVREVSSQPLTIEGHGAVRTTVVCRALRSNQPLPPMLRRPDLERRRPPPRS